MNTAVNVVNLRKFEKLISYFETDILSFAIHRFLFVLLTISNL